MSEKYTHFPYRINQPSRTYVLSVELREISGLTYKGDHKLLCVNDEQGSIFEYDTQNRKITQRIKFAKKGDFEAVELVGDKAVALRSDGKLYFIEDLSHSKSESIKVKTGLGDKNDTEGLAYDVSNHTLLIACKGLAHNDSAYMDKRAIYRYSIKDSSLSQYPDILIDQGELETILNLDPYTKFSNKLLKGGNPSKGNLTFQPSALAIHPISRNIYVLGSVGKLLLVLSPQGELLAVNRLKHKIFPQPEGICFTPDGTLFISTEGKMMSGKIYQFDYKPNTKN
ncbi:SdiA-regulated domain-containing protein [Ancylomarina salipaludis]|uniref:SdiA-regulated domain-containing protein n=1 Tax=Ancylomarina salipaludis TaxID=2501299 RepID=UPI0013E9607D|nr:SdiA-regulated domain-containing protein [Ancylomarina salipaludis]